MKQSLLGTIVFLALAAGVEAQEFTLQVDAGLLENADGVTPVPAGGLLELIASPSGNFAAPTGSSYVSGDNVLVTSFAMDYDSGTVGETVNSLINIPLSNGSFTLTPGESLLLRFYPNLTLAGEPASPPLGSAYGQVRSSTIEAFTSGPADAAQTPWIVPAAGVTADIYYNTVDDGGVPNGTTYTNPTAFATNVVLPAIPEPSTRATLGAGLAGLLGLAAWRRRRGVLV